MMNIIAIQQMDVKRHHLPTISPSSYEDEYPSKNNYDIPQPSLPDSNDESFSQDEAATVL